MKNLSYRDEIECVAPKETFKEWLGNRYIVYRSKRFIENQKKDIHNFFNDGDLVPPFKRLVFTIFLISVIGSCIILFFIPSYFISYWITTFMPAWLAIICTVTLYLVIIIALFKALESYVQYQHAYDKRKEKDSKDKFEYLDYESL